jgi:serine phosphatase RsbU (regulator of sigma subunit)
LVASAIRDHRFAADPLVRARNLKSILALRFTPPGSSLQALWYLENDLVEGAFTADRVVGLKLLSGQVGISLENARMYRALTDLNRDLEGKVRDRTAELEERNRQFLHSVEYAAVLQRSLLPRSWGTSVADHLALWVPKDLVGGDLYWFRESEEGCLLALVDCTGHGVPGSLITMLVHSILDDAWASSPSGDLATILTKANQQFRRALGQHRPGSESNDGFDIGLLWWSPQGGGLKFAGARISLVHSAGPGMVWVHGGRKALGYPETPEDWRAEVHEIPRVPGARYYLSSDGFLGQVGGEKSISFGRDRFQALVGRTSGFPMDEQGRLMQQAFEAYRGTRPQADDITVLGVQFQ